MAILEVRDRDTKIQTREQEKDSNAYFLASVQDYHCKFLIK